MPDSSDRLSFTLFLAAAVHAVLIFGVTFTISKRDKIAPTLNITLATHKSQKAPDKADFLAQYDQEGSGTEKEVKELTTDQVAKMADVTVNQVNPLPKQKRHVEDNRKQQLVTTLGDAKRKIETQSKTDKSAIKEASDAPVEVNEPYSQEYASLKAKLEHDKQQWANEPRITRHTSVTTKSSDEAAYYNQWSQKVMRVGNKNFPKEAIRKSIFGNLRMSVKIRADGSIADVEILESSGHAILDDAALRIIRLSAPFDPFPPEIKKSTDIFEIIRTWKFEITGLSTSS